MSSTQDTFVTNLYAQQETLLALNATYTTILNADAAQLANVLAKPKPNYTVSGPTGEQHFGWGDYARMLQDSVKAMTEAIRNNMKTLVTLNELIVLNQPYQFQQRMI